MTQRASSNWSIMNMVDTSMTEEQWLDQQYTAYKASNIIGVGWKVLLLDVETASRSIMPRWIPWER